MLKCAILADFLDFENGCCYLNTIARKRRKNTWVSCIFAYELKTPTSDATSIALKDGSIYSKGSL